MIKYYCDICGKEVGEYQRFSLPDVTYCDNDIKDGKGNVIYMNRTHKTEPKVCDICKTCAMDIACVISGLKYAHENNAFLDNGQELFVSYKDHEFVWRRRKE